MKTRKQIQQELLESIKSLIENNDKGFTWDSPALAIAAKGKYSWTYREVYEAVEKDTTLEGSDCNLIDDMIHYYEWKEQQGKQ